MTASSGSASSSARSAGVDLVPGVLGGTWTTTIQYEEEADKKETEVALDQWKAEKIAVTNEEAGYNQAVKPLKQMEQTKVKMYSSALLER